MRELERQAKTSARAEPLRYSTLSIYRAQLVRHVHPTDPDEGVEALQSWLISQAMCSSLIR